ncbi:hypothetical protein WMO64_01735 [Pseudoflavonifractor sp. CLA-AP-H29]|uniref:Uncharacterized protein n=1 Tax=Pseudoflavonifractor intestinihominis TaxID=3133171 RepID=A0ABV1E4G2_9FIRM
MKDYVRALHDRFCRTSSAIREKEEMEQAYAKLKAVMHDVSQRKLLLALIDAQSMLQNQVSLDSFAAGLQLGLGLYSELEPYSYEADIENRALRRMEEMSRMCP